MPDYRRWFRGGGTYFFTVVTFNRRKIFRSSHARASLRRAIAEVRAARPFDVLGAVLLPDHIHYNPVKHGHAKCPHQWKYSSFQRWVKAGVCRPDWLCQCRDNSEPPDFEAIGHSVGE